MRHSGKYDAVVVGAGTAGTAAALSLARAGQRVLLAERRPLGEAGARWVNGVPLWMYDAASIERPGAPELRESGRFVVRAAQSNRCIIIDPNPAPSIDVRHLVARLHALAVSAGVTLVGDSQVREHRLDGGGRLRALSFDAPEPYEVEADLFVDATGLAAKLRDRVPRLAASTPRVEAHDLCTAAQYVFELSDRAGASEWLRAHALESHDILCTLGGDGGFSTANLSVDLHAEEAEILTGSLADGEHASGPQIVERLCAAHPWIGERKFGGSGAIPLRRPYDRLASAGLALVGNAACQVFPAHGSGTGIGMIAGRMLARAVTRHDDIGGERALWAYQARFHRAYGGLLAFYDLVRRHSQTLGGHQVAGLLRDGLINASSQRAALEQRVPAAKATEVLRMLPGLGRQRREAFGLARALGPGPAVLAHHARYPQSVSEDALRAWSRRGAWLRGDRADVDA